MTRPDTRLFYNWRPSIREDSWTAAALAGVGIVGFIVSVFVIAGRL